MGKEAMLESLHMQAASIDDEGTVWQNDGIPVQLLKAPYQQVAGMLQSMATRNRTAAAANSRKECEGLYEIDKVATLGSDKNLTDKELTNVNMARTGSAWDRNTALQVRPKSRSSSYVERKNRRPRMDMQGAGGREEGS